MWLRSFLPCKNILSTAKLFLFMCSRHVLLTMYLPSYNNSIITVR